MEWLPGTIGLLGVLLGAGITGLLSIRLERVRSINAARDELRAALQSYGYALDRLGQEIGQLPATTGRLARATQSALEHTPQLDWSLGQLARHTLARPAMQALDGYNAAANRLLLVAPLNVLKAVERINQLLAGVEDRDHDWNANWRTARVGLAEAARAAVAPTSRRS